MLGEAYLAGIAQQVLRASRADQTEVMVTSSNAHLTRFATNTIHQNVSETDVSVRIRAIIDQKTGVASGNEITEDGIQRLVESAETIAGFQQANPEFRSLPGPADVGRVDGYVEATAAYSPMERAEGVERVLRMSRASGLDAAGAFSTEEQEIYIANSLGVSVYHRGSIAGLLTVIMGPDSSGYAASASIDVRDIDAEQVGRTAVDKALSSAKPQPLDPGEYTVILEEEAVADMVFFLGWMGLGALAVQEERSFMNGRLGRMLKPRNVSAELSRAALAMR